jgi:hypothetical protein
MQKIHTALRETIKFWGLCIKHAFRDSFSIANAWSGLWGPLLLWLVIKWGGYKVNLPEDAIGQAVVMTLAGAVATWFGVLVVRFIRAPALVYWEQRQKADALAENKSKTKAQLEQFYMNCGYIIKAIVPRDDEAEFQKYAGNTNLWLGDAAKWIEENMGAFARERFLDRTGMMAAYVQGAVNEKHSTIIQNLTRHRQNLKAMIDALPN